MNFDYLFNKKYYGEELIKNRHLKKNLGCQIINNGTILPYRVKDDGTAGGGVLDSEGNFIPSTFLCYNKNGDYKPENVKISNKTVIYLGAFYIVWGHLLTDNMRRLWFLKSNIYRNYFKNCSLIYLPWDDFDFEKTPLFFQFAKILEILGINYKDIQPVKEATIYTNVIIPDESFFYIPGQGRYFTEEYRETIDYIRQHLLKYYGALNYTSQAFKKLYFFHGMRNQVGEERIAQYFQSKGYAIVNGFRLTLEDEFNLLINCESFAAAIGSTAHNSIFLRDNAEVILIPRAPFLTDYQEALNQVHNLRITYVDSTISIFSKGGEGPFYYFLSDNLRRYFDDNVKEIFIFDDLDFKKFVSYVKFALSKGFQINLRAIEYYGDIAKEFLNQLKQHDDILKEEGIVIN